jgi:hypothetical protein
VVVATSGGVSIKITTTMEKERKAFNFFKSYYEVYKMLPTPEAKDDFITALCEKQFFGIEPDIDAIDVMAKFAYLSQKHSIDASRNGFDDIQKRKDYKGVTDTPTVGGTKGATNTPTVQVKEQEEVKVKEQVKEERFNFRFALLSLGVDEKLVSEWMQVRKDKKATNTETAFKHLKTEIQKSGLTAQECIEMAVVGSWMGFKAEYAKNQTNNGQRKAHQSERQNYEFNI